MKPEHDATDNVRQLLSDLTHADAERIRPTLLSLQTMAHREVPAPSQELLAALDSSRSSATAHPHRLRRRGLVLSLTLIGALAAGTGTAYAVSPQFRSDTAHTINGIINAIPFGHPGIVHRLPTSIPSVVHTPAPPTIGNSTPHPTPSPGTPIRSNGNGKFPSGHANPKATNHPTPPPTRPGNGRGGGAP